MPIITISRDPYLCNEEIVKKIAKKLGYKYINPEMIQHACDSLNLPHPKIQKEAYDSPTLLEHLSAEKKQRSARLIRVLNTVIQRQREDYEANRKRLYALRDAGREDDVYYEQARQQMDDAYTWLKSATNILSAIQTNPDSLKVGETKTRHLYEATHF